jgi:O-antigen ligase
MDKAFFYAYVCVSCGAIMCIRARRLMTVLVPTTFAVYVLLVPVVSGSVLPQTMSRLIQSETAQQSLGGAGGRDTLISDGLGIWARAPIFGVGPGNNYPYMVHYSTLGTAHNQYINLLMELGLVGFGCFAWFALQAFRLGLKLLRTAQHPSHRTLAVAWFGIFAAFLAGGMFGDFMLPSIRNSGLELFAEYYVQWVILGLVVSAAAIERRLQRGVRAYEYA